MGEMGAKKDPKASSKTPAKNPKKKKWSKGKSRDKLNNLVLFDKNTYDKLYKEVPTYKLITPSIVSERLKIRGSLARRALDEMEQKNLIRKVSAHRSQLIYTRMIKDEAEDAPEGGVVVEKKAPKQKMGKKAKKEAAEAEAAEAE